jgi:FdhD protein
VATTLEIPIATVSGARATRRVDRVAVEAPLEIRLGDRPISVTMRTPGEDRELAAGLLFAEGVVRAAADLARVESLAEDVVRVDLAKSAAPAALARLQRSFASTSSCGVCGKTSLVALRSPPARSARDSTEIEAQVIYALPARLREAQAAFDRTGGLHAAALFDTKGALQLLREDVGRHNAVDKLVGAELLAGRVPLSGRVLFLSGRAGFELVEKARVAEVPVVAAIGAPSSLAVEVAKGSGMLLIGFVREGRFNVYAGAERLLGAADA